MPNLQLIKDLRIALKDMENYVKNPAFLIKGREFKNFQLRPREAWANWLICVVLNEIYGDSFTFGENPDSDGMILDTKTGNFIVTEHVSALENVFNILPKGDDRIIQAIDSKIKRGPQYAAGKTLVVFFDGAGEFYRNKIRENIKGRHNFKSIFCIGHITSSIDGGYVYAVTQFKDSYGDQSITYKVEISNNFNSWEVSQIRA